MTTQATHTPGPWKSVKGARPTRPDIVADCGLICSLEYGPDEGEANARLIAAAPDLLEALNRLVCGFTENIDGEELYGDWIQIAEEAIAKAEGRAE